MRMAWHPRKTSQRAVLGISEDQESGIRFQIARFNEHALKAVFFVEALSASVVGLDTLKRTIDPILSAGHDVQLHIHTEWLNWLPGKLVDDARGEILADYSLAHQCRLVEMGMDNLMRAGAPRPVAFRAGSYGADRNTLSRIGGTRDRVRLELQLFLHSQAMQDFVGQTNF